MVTRYVEIRRKSQFERFFFVVFCSLVLLYLTPTNQARTVLVEHTSRVPVEQNAMTILHHLLDDIMNESRQRELRQMHFEDDDPRCVFSLSHSLT